MGPRGASLAVVNLISIKPRQGQTCKRPPTFIALRRQAGVIDRGCGRHGLVFAFLLGYTMLPDPILTNSRGAEVLAPGLTRPEFKPRQAFRPVPIIRAAGQMAWLGCNAQDGAAERRLQASAGRALAKKARARRRRPARAGLRIFRVTPNSFSPGRCRDFCFRGFAPGQGGAGARTSGH